METILFIIIGIIGFFIFLQVFIRFASILKKGKTITGINGELGRKIKSGSKLLIYFYSPTCGACRTITPIIDKLKKERSNIYKIDASRDTKLAQQFGIMGTPATVVVNNEKIAEYILGAKSENFLRKLLD